MVQTFVKRPTSPLHFEPLYTPPEDVLYPGSEEEAASNEREKKRLRVETQGRQYLNGRPLFIQSAGLRGPFQKDWVNPWAKKKRKYRPDDVRRFPEAGTEAIPSYPPVQTRPSTAKRRSVAGSGYASHEYGSEKETSVASEVYEQREPKAKRRRHADGRHDLGVAAQDRKCHDWLKTDKARLRTHSKEDARYSTPTPVAKSRSTSHVTSSPQFEQLDRAKTLPHGSNDQRRLSPNKQPFFEFVDAKSNATSTAKQEADVEAVEVATIDENPGGPATTSTPSIVRERSLSKIDIVTRNGYDEARRLSQQARRQAESEDGQLQAKKLSEEAVARAIESDRQKPTSRLTPYVSEAVLGNDAASSAALRAAKAQKPKPSPRVVPPSTHQPEFRYRYTSKTSSSSTSPRGAPFVDAPEKPQARPRSHSSSSSGSSAFAEALEAAQEKAALRSFVSSKSSSPAIEGPETKCVERKRRAPRRLTFTPSGGHKIAPARTSSRLSSSSSVAGPAKVEKAYQDKPPSNHPPSLPRTSTKSSARSLTIANVSRNSITLPEAQSDPIARPPLAQAPSGPSTNLLETDEPSPKVLNPDEGDSYLDLSTQAAVWKVQRSFQADVVASLASRRPKKEESSTVSPMSRVAKTTPTARGRWKTEAANAQLVEPSDNDDEEPMSTQAMVDAISPFAITTIKKRPSIVRKRTSLIPSPTITGNATSPQAPIPFPESPTTTAFRTHSPGMSTSQSLTPSPSPEKSPPPIPLSRPTTNSKPPSSLTSFSILPNGTLTETSVYQQDGQQQHDIPDYDITLPLDPFGLDDADGNGDGQGGSWDLNAAIEEAGDFLGEWDVEAEARKEGRLSGKRASGNKSALKGGSA